MVDVAPSGDMTVRLSASDVELVVAALRLLRSILGRDEADELAEVVALLTRLESGRSAAPGQPA
jgi:hypothetical protein